MGKILPITIHPHPVLQQVAEPCNGADTATLTLAEDMIATLAIADGVGLAAPQVAASKRLIIIDLGTEGEDGKRNYSIKNPEIIINPEIVSFGAEKLVKQEGCLSLPGLWADVERSTSVVVRYMGRDGQMCEETANGLRAVVFQHEIDHLNGILFTDRLTAARKAVAMPKWQKLRMGLIKNGGEFDVLAAERGLLLSAAHREALEETEDEE